MSPLNPNAYLGDVPQSREQWYKPAGGSNIGQAQRSLADAAEEMSWAIAEEVEDRTLEERSLEEYTAPNGLKLEEIEALLQLMRDEGAGHDIGESAARLITLARERKDLMLASHRWSRESGSQYGYRGEMKQYAALVYALHDAEAKGESPRVLESLRDAAERCMQDHGPQIRAGINTAQQAAIFGQNRDAVDRFRATYQDAVLGQASFSATLQLVLERFGDELERGIELLRKALGADMAALQPSREPERLNAVLQDLYQLATAANILQRCRAIVQRLQQYVLLNDLQPLTLMQDLVGWTIEPWVMGYHVTLLLDKYCPADDEIHPEYRGSKDQSEGEGGDGEESDEDDAETTRIVLLHGVLTVMRDLPPKVFASDEHRLQAMEAIQQVLDAKLIPEE